MVIIITMKNLKQRGDKFHFRMTIPLTWFISVSSSVMGSEINTNSKQNFELPPSTAPCTRH